MELSQIANNIRISMLEALTAAGSGHTGGPMGIADVMAYLYFEEMHINPQDPKAEDRDRFVLSAAHMVPVLYATLAERGFFPKSELKTLRQSKSRLKGHTFRDLDIGVETTGGSLGQGIGIAVGMALAAQLREQQAASGRPGFRTYCVIGDGESNEGSVWEAAMLAAKYKLDNLCVILDRNNIQLSGSGTDIMPLEPLAAKWEAFNWQVLQMDGHDFKEMSFAFSKARLSKNRPTIIIAHTIAGKGVSFMENKWEWHGKVPTPAELKLALQELTHE